MSNTSSKYLDKAVLAFKNLPGVGEKSALRFALHLVKNRPYACEELISALTNIKDHLKNCSNCGNLADENICSICLDHKRKTGTLCVVESVRDLMAIEETGQFFGSYHVLGGLISPIEGIGPEELNLENLARRIKEESIEEIIMAVSPTIEGETTIYFLSNLITSTETKISVIARGVAFGGELEYADELTLGRSILSRIPYAKQENT
jgi:recombination protein RecR